MTKVNISVVQCAFASSEKDNIDKVVTLAEQAVSQNGDIILLPELCHSLYFAQTQDPKFFDLASPLQESPVVKALTTLSSTNSKVIIVPFFERCHQEYFNSTAIIDSGRVLGVYRKCHIPDGPGYQEKFYFRPGLNPMRAWKTSYGNIGVGICWDQWFPEAARLMALEGADILFYPTAIGSEPEEPELDSSAPWRRVMQGHAVANCVYVAAANRIGKEGDITFYGTSFICDQRGELQCDLADKESVATATVDIDALRQERANWGFFRDRRPELYSRLSRCSSTSDVVDAEHGQTDKLHRQ